VEQFVQKANTLASIDFVILAGDITDFGLLKEYKLIDRMLSKLDKPYISVIGNHDVLAHGEEVYKHMFGPTDFSFVYRDVKFIMHNTNGREYPEGNVPDMTWLKQEFADDDMAKFYIAVSHIPPFDPDFDSTLVQPYTELLSNRSNVLVSLHGHIHKHKDGYPYEDGVRYITSYSFEQKSFLLLQIVNGELIKTIIDY
jgi:3',5'-cyclic-AMP phosphodiesterase